ncbi:MAG: VIT1/CCC1 transporter family protein [Methyloligellaceae bacterium]
MTLEHEHTVEAIQARLNSGIKPNYIRDWVYGGIDGAVTTFAIVAGVVGANLSSGIILVLGLANLLADGLSMAASNYSGTKSEVDDADRLREIEKKHIDQVPVGEREEIRQILIQKGLEGDVLDDATNAIIANEKIWIETMLVDEYGVSPVIRKPMNSALATFFAFVLCGAVPLLPFLTPIPQPFIVASVFTGIVFFAIGSMKSRWSLATWWYSGLETLIIGSGAAGVAYIVGYLLKGLA